MPISASALIALRPVSFLTAAVSTRNRQKSRVGKRPGMLAHRTSASRRRKSARPRYLVAGGPGLLRRSAADVQLVLRAVGERAGAGAHASRAHLVLAARERAAGTV